MTEGQELFEMEKGSIVSLYNQDFVVEELVKLHKGSCNYLLKDGAAVKWLCVRNLGAVTAVLCDQVALAEESFGETLHYGGVDYRLLALGKARAVATSAMGYPRFVNVSYYDYSAGDDRHYLFIVQSGGQLTALAGESVIRSAIMVFPKPN